MTSTAWLTGFPSSLQVVDTSLADLPGATINAVATGGAMLFEGTAIATRPRNFEVGVAGRLDVDGHPGHQRHHLDGEAVGQHGR